MKKITYIVLADTFNLINLPHDMWISHMSSTVELVNAFYKNLYNSESKPKITLQKEYYLPEAFLHPNHQRVFPEWLKRIQDKDLIIYTFSPFFLQTAKKPDVVKKVDFDSNPLFKNINKKIGSVEIRQPIKVNKINL